MPLEFYRYISYCPEVDQMIRERKIQSTNPNTGFATWWTPQRYDDPDDAEQELALDGPPTHRVGPVPADEIPAFDIPLRPVAPKGGKSGGGLEARTKSPVWLFGVRDFQNSWDL